MLDYVSPLEPLPIVDLTGPYYSLVILRCPQVFSYGVPLTHHPQVSLYIVS